jgi:histone-lysine N-methyltransferase SETD1
VYFHPPIQTTRFYHNLYSIPTASRIYGHPNDLALEASNREVRALSRQFAAGSGNDDVSSGELTLKRKKIMFKKSPIHDFGVYALEHISKDEFVMEYTGVVYRTSIGDVKERRYVLEGMDSTYLFSVQDQATIDATYHGNVARFVNHSCSPNCTPKCRVIAGKKRILIYALQDIEPGSEITYDYKFPVEEDNKIKCLCGSANCRGYLN